MGADRTRRRVETLPPGVTGPARRRANTEPLFNFPPAPAPALIDRVAVVAPRLVPPPVAPPTTFAERAPAPPVLPARMAAGTVPPPVLERPLPSLFDVVARIREYRAAGLPVPPLSAAPATADEDDVEVIHVDLDDDEILLGEADLLD
jgi:hypothetical protein